jgi:hypothetical protein
MWIWPKVVDLEHDLQKEQIRIGFASFSRHLRELPGQSSASRASVIALC